MDFGLGARLGCTRRSRETIAPQEVGRFTSALSTFLAPCNSGFVPLGFHWCIGLDVATTAELSADGSAPGLLGLPPPELPHRVWAGGSVRFYAAIPIGATVERTDRIEAVEMKMGRDGPIALMTIHCQFRTEKGLAIDEWRTIAFCNRTSEPPRAGKPTRMPPQTASAAAASWNFDPDSILLFRYSALTFNAHRIHFDRQYCLSTEGLNGLVVQGPLQATVLINACAKVSDGKLRQLNYRNHRVLIDQPGARIDVHREDSNRLSAVIYDRSGERTATATAY